MSVWFSLVIFFCSFSFANIWNSCIPQSYTHIEDYCCERKKKISPKRGENEKQFQRLQKSLMLIMLINYSALWKVNVHCWLCCHSLYARNKSDQHIWTSVKERRFKWTCKARFDCVRIYIYIVNWKTNHIFRPCVKRELMMKKKKKRKQTALWITRSSIHIIWLRSIRIHST